jgi:hypothetical protein
LWHHAPILDGHISGIVPFLLGGSYLLRGFGESIKNYVEIGYAH